MSRDKQDRLISASEVERWCYCPLSWKLERSGSIEVDGPLKQGTRMHHDIGDEAVTAKRAQKKAKEDTIITWTFLIFSMVLLLMGTSLIVVARVGSLDIDVWKIGVIFISILMIGVSLAYYFSNRDGTGKLPGESLVKLIRGLDSKKWKRSNTPILFYFYGVLLLVNGIILLRPFDMDQEIVATFLAVSLLVLYLMLLISFTTCSGESVLGWFMAGTPSSLPDNIPKPHLLFYPINVLDALKRYTEQRPRRAASPVWLWN